MKYPQQLIKGRLVKRYKRFLADVRLDDGTEITVHCPNTGSMKNCAELNSRVWLLKSNNPKRKYAYTWEWVEVFEKYKACVNTQRANQLVLEALEKGLIPGVEEYSMIVREPKVEDGRLDFCLEHSSKSTVNRKCWIEVKSVTLLEQDDGQGYFPDAVTARGLKHLERLKALRQSGDQTMLVFCVPHEGIRKVTSAEQIDPNYAQALREAQQAGVEVIVLAVRFYEPEVGFDTADFEIKVTGQLPISSL